MKATFLSVFALGAMVCPAVELAGGWTADGEPVALPHTWNLTDAADGVGQTKEWRRLGYSSGATSYVRKVVRYCRALPDPKPGKRYFLKCDGAALKTETRVNGTLVGRHVGGFTAFCHEITSALKPTGNALEMSVDSRVDWDVQPINADFSVYGGIYRVPELIEKGATCIDPTRTPVVTADPKTGHVRVEIPVLDGPPGGRPLPTRTVVRELDIPDFELWSPENPKLYPVTVRVGDDSWTTRVGFRTAEFRADGFYLNGLKRRLRGVNRHQDREDRGWGRTRADEAEDIRWMKLMGVDAVRTSHYPQSPAFYDLCDEAGILVWTEVPNVNGLTFTEAARVNELNEAREMVEQHRNHPCIFTWGIFNELYNRKMEDGSAEPRMIALRDYVKKLDPTRPVTSASCQVKRTSLNAITDVVGYNLYPGWYGRTSTEMDVALEEARRYNPTRKIYSVSEYGCSGCVAQHADAKFRIEDTTSSFHPEEYQAYHHWGNYRAIAADPCVWGSFAWVMFDAGSDARHEGYRFGINDKGFVTWDRSTAKDAFHFYKANWNPAPELHVVGSRMGETTDERATVMVFSNVGDVTLAVNGRTVGTKAADAVKTAMWENVPLATGDNEIVVTAGGLRRAVLWKRRPPSFPKFGKPRAITSGPKDHFFANYFAINAWSADLRHVAVLETEINGRLPEPGERCTLGLVDTWDNNRFIPVTTTACWNFQEATMFHWLPGEPDTFVFNDLRDGKFRAVVMNWKTKAERVLPHPVSAVSRDGTKAVSINYARLSLTRPDYGYAGPGQDPRLDVEWPEDDGLWFMDMKTGESKLILSVAQGRSLMPATKADPTKPGHPLAYYCHTVINPSATRVFFLARSIDWFDAKIHKASSWKTTSFTVKTDGTDLRRCFAGDWGGSHFNWLNDDTMVVTVYPAEIGPGKCWHVRFTVGDEKNVRRIAPGLLDWDGHCVYSPDGRWMSTEGYFDGTYLRNWVLMRCDDEACLPVGSFFVPEAYRGGYWRCDLHGRWRPDGRQLGINSVHEGSRQVYVLDLDFSGR